MIPVLARVNKFNEVEVCELSPQPTGEIAIPARAFYYKLGALRRQKIRRNVAGRIQFRDEWVWSSEGYSGTGATKEEAVANMLSDAGYYEVAIEATITPLF